MCLQIAFLGCLAWSLPRRGKETDPNKVTLIAFDKIPKQEQCDELEVSHMALKAILILLRKNNNCVIIYQVKFHFMMMMFMKCFLITRR